MKKKNLCTVTNRQWECREEEKETLKIYLVKRKHIIYNLMTCRIKTVYKTVYMKTYKKGIASLDHIQHKSVI